MERMVAGTDYMARQHGTARLTDPAAGHVTHSMQRCQQPQVSTSGFREYGMIHLRLVGYVCPVAYINFITPQIFTNVSECQLHAAC